MVAAERLSRRGALTVASNARRSSGALKQAALPLERSSVPAPAEDMAGLPVEVESAYRLDIARELRKDSFLSQQREALGRAGSVRFIISYWAGLHAPLVAIERPSAYPELDEMAATSLAAAVARAQPPEMATGGGFRMSFVVEYRQAR